MRKIENTEKTIKKVSLIGFRRANSLDEKLVAIVTRFLPVVCLSVCYLWVDATAIGPKMYYSDKENNPQVLLLT